MTWSAIARLVQRSRAAATLAGAGAVALISTLGLETRYFRPSMAGTIRIFMLWFVVAWVVLAVAFTLILTLAEHRAEKRPRVEDRVPRAIARQRAAIAELPAPVAPIVTRVPDPQPTRGDQPAFLGQSQA